MKKNKEKRVRKPLKDLTLLDRFLFDTAMSVPEICHNMLSIILDDPHLPKIHYSIAEKTQEPFYDSRAVRLDLLAFDENDVVYDAEAQKKNTGIRNLKRRSRLYQSHIDVNLMERKGTVYVYSVNTLKKYSYPAKVTYNYPKPDAPSYIHFTEALRGVNVLVAPGPDVTHTAAIFPLYLAYASAAMAHACS